MHRSPLLLCLCLITGTAFAAEESSLDNVLQGFDEPAEETADPSLDAVLGGFDEEAATTVETMTTDTAKKPWQFGGAVTLGAAWNYAHEAPENGETNYRGLSRLRGKLNLEFDTAFTMRPTRSTAATTIPMRCWRSTKARRSLARRGCRDA